MYYSRTDRCLLVRCAWVGEARRARALLMLASWVSLQESAGVRDPQVVGECQGAAQSRWETRRHATCVAGRD